MLAGPVGPQSGGWKFMVEAARANRLHEAAQGDVGAPQGPLQEGTNEVGVEVGDTPRIEADAAPATQRRDLGPTT